MDSTVMLPNIDPITAFDDNMQVQCLPVYGLDQAMWTHRRVPKVTAFQTFPRLPFWSRKPQKFTYHTCAEDLTNNTIFPALPEEDRKAPLEDGVLPPDSSAKDGFCVMFSLVSQVVSHWLQLPDTSGQSLPMHVQILDPKRKIIALRSPYHEDSFSLPGTLLAQITVHGASESGI